MVLALLAIVELVKVAEGVQEHHDQLGIIIIRFPMVDLDEVSEGVREHKNIFAAIFCIWLVACKVSLT